MTHSPPGTADQGGRKAGKWTDGQVQCAKESREKGGGTEKEAGVRVDRASEIGGKERGEERERAIDLRRAGSDGGQIVDGERRGQERADGLDNGLSKGEGLERGRTDSWRETGEPAGRLLDSCQAGKRGENQTDVEHCAGEALGSSGGRSEKCVPATEIRSQSPVITEAQNRGSTIHGRPRGSLGESIQVLQLELAQMQASSSWATRSLFPGITGELNRAEFIRAMTNRVVTLSSGCDTAEKVANGLENQAGKGRFLPSEGEEESLRHEATSVGEGLISQQGSAVQGLSDHALVQGLAEKEPNIATQKEMGSAGPGVLRPTGKTGEAHARQFLADFLELEGEADWMTSREAYLKQKALSAANERRRLTGERKRPPSGESIPECVEVLEEEGVVGKVEEERRSRMLSVFTLQESGGGQGVVKGEGRQVRRKWEPKLVESAAEKGVVSSTGRSVERNPERPEPRESHDRNGRAKERNGEGSGRDGQAKEWEEAAVGDQKSREKDDLTARLAAEVAALRARLAAKDAEIMRIRETEVVKEQRFKKVKALEAVVPFSSPLMVPSESVSKGKELGRGHAAGELQERSNGTEWDGAQRNGMDGTEGAPGERGTEPVTHGAARSSEMGGGQTVEQGRRESIRGSSLAWEFVPPESGAAPTYERSVQKPNRPRGDPSEPPAASHRKAPPPPPRRSSPVRNDAPSFAFGAAELGSVNMGSVNTASAKGPCNLEGSNQRRRGSIYRGESAFMDIPLEREVSQDSLNVGGEVTRARPISRDVHVDTTGYVARPGEPRDRPRATSREREREASSLQPIIRVPYALPGESGISAARVWEAYQVSRTQTPLLKPPSRQHLEHARTSRAEAWLTTAYRQSGLGPPTSQEAVMLRPVDVGKRAAALGQQDRAGFSRGLEREGFVRGLDCARGPSALSLEEQSILASLQRLDVRLQDVTRKDQGASCSELLILQLY
jgi:hypothetical protein